MAEEATITTVGHLDRTHAGHHLGRSRDGQSVGVQPDIPDSIEYYNAVEAFRPEDVDLATHDARRCNLPVDACPACSAAEHDEGPVYDWMVNPADYELDEPELEPQA